MPAEDAFPFAPRHALPDFAAAALFVGISIAYWWHATFLARVEPYWMDEVLAVWTARQPDAVHVWSALAHGAEFTPPLFDLLLHGLVRIGAGGMLAMRLPSILAFYLAALAMAALVRRHGGWPAAVLATAVVLTGGSFVYAVQARPYAAVVAAFAWALVVWDRLPPGPVSWRRVALLAGLLTLVVGLHFYGLLLVLTLALAELSRMLGRERIRAGVLAAVLIAVASILLWWPILRAAHVYSAGDVRAPGYYGRPTAAALLATYRSLVGWWLLPTLLLGAAAIVLARRSRRIATALGRPTLILCVIPCGIFLFALLVSHSYADRYAIAFALGLALLLAWLVLQLGRYAATVALLLTASALGHAISGWHPDPDRLARLRLVRTASPDLPIVTGDGLAFLELQANLPAAATRRIWFADLLEVVSPDPTNRHQVERWRAMRPDLPVMRGGTLRCSDRPLLALTDPFGGTDDLPRWLAARGIALSPPQDRAALTPIRLPRCRRPS